MENKCLQSGVVYQATITRGDEKVDTYIGLSAPPFKDRWRNHNSSFKTRIPKDQQAPKKVDMWTIGNVRAIQKDRVQETEPKAKRRIKEGECKRMEEDEQGQCLVQAPDNLHSNQTAGSD